MLQIYIYGKNREGFLDLPPGSSLDVETLTELFDEELALGTFSLPGEAEWTDNNKLLLDFVEMNSTVPDAELPYCRCDVLDDLNPKMLDAKFTLLGFNGSFNYETGKYSYTISGNKGIFGSLVGQKTLRDLSLDKITLPAGDTSRTFATKVMKADPAYMQYSYLRFAPAAILNFFDTGRPDYNNEFLAQDIVNDIVVTGSDWEFGRPLSSNINSPAAPGNSEYVDFRTVPFLAYKWVMQKIFSEFGYAVTGEWMQDATWDDAFMFNNMAIEKYNTENYTDVNTVIELVKHLPKKQIGTFLRDLGILFNVKYSFLDGRTVSIDYRKNSLKNKKVIDVSNVTGRMFSGDLSDYKQKGFTFSFNFDSADNYIGDRVKEIDSTKVVATITKYAEIGDVVIGRVFEYNDLIYVTAENQYFAYTNGVGTNAWDYFSENLLPYVIPGTNLSAPGDGDYKYETGISPMATYLLYDELNDKRQNQDMVAADIKGSYYNKRFTLVENDFDTRIFFIKMIAKNGVTVPSSFVESCDIFNVKRVPVSLAWGGPDGLYINYWQPWINFLMNTRKIKTSLDLDEDLANQLQATPTLLINGTYYLPSNIISNIPQKGPVDVELYRK